MGLAVRIIPQLLCRGRQLIKGSGFESWRSVGVVEQAVRIHQIRGVDELTLLDIGATPENRGPDLKLVESLAQKCFMPLAIGGGIKSKQDVRDLLNHGADKVVLGTQAVENPNLVKEISDSFGASTVVVALDVKQNTVWSRCGTKQWIYPGPIGYARMMEKFGAGEIVITNIEREGTMEGYDIELIRSVSQAVNVPVVASGGCSGYEDMVNAVKAGASAVSAGALFQFESKTPIEAARYLQQNNIEARV